MDTKKLVVGQDVCMRCGPYYGTWGKVIKVTPSGQVDVMGYESTGLVHFDAKGHSDFDSGTEWGGPWELYDGDPAAYVESRQRQRAANIKHAAEAKIKYEERKKNWFKALYS